MAKTNKKNKTLREAALEIFSNNIKSKGTGEPFGAYKVRNVKIPGQKGFGGDESEHLGGSPTDPEDSGICAAERAAPEATPPGSVGLDHGETIRNDLRTGKNIAGSKGSRAKVDDSGIVSEEGGEHSKVNSPTTHKIEKMGPDSDDKNPLSGIMSEEEEEEKRLKEEEEEEKRLKEEGDLGFPQNKENHMDAGEFKAKPVSDRVKSYVREKGAAEAVKEDIKAMFQGQEGLSEDFVAKATKIYEAAVTAAAIKVCESVEADYVEQLQNISAAIQESVEVRVDDYLNYMVEQWVDENQVAIESGLRAELVEDFISGMHQLFAEHYIDVPADKVDVVEELSAKVEELEGRLNEEIASSVALKKQLSEHSRDEIVDSLTEGLTDTQREKIRGLAETVEYTTEASFVDSVKTLKETYYPSKKPANTQDKTQLNEIVGENGEDIVQKPTTTNMQRYTRALSKTKLI